MSLSPIDARIAWATGFVWRRARMAASRFRTGATRWRGFTAEMRSADLPGPARLAWLQTLAHGSVFEAVGQPSHPRAPKYGKMRVSCGEDSLTDRKSTRLNSSHLGS